MFSTNHKWQDDVRASDNGPVQSAFEHPRNQQGDVPWQKWTSTICPTGIPAPNAARRSQYLSGSKPARAARPIFGIATPATTGSRRWRSTVTRSRITKLSRPDGWPCEVLRSGRLPALLANRQPDPNHQSVRLAVIEGQLAAMRQYNGVRDGKPETKARGFIHVAGVVAAHEWFQHEPLARIGNAGTIVLDVDRRGIRRHSQADRGLRTEPDRVLHEIGNAAMQIVGPHRGHGMCGAVIGDLVSHVGELIGDELQRGCDVGQRHGFELAV